MPCSGCLLASFIAFVSHSIVGSAVAQRCGLREVDGVDAGAAEILSVVPLLPEDSDHQEEFISLIQMSHIKDAVGEKAQSELLPKGIQKEYTDELKKGMKRMTRHMVKNFGRMSQVVGKRGAQMQQKYLKMKADAEEKSKEQQEKYRKQAHDWALEQVQDDKDKERKKYDYFVHNLNEYPEKYYRMGVTNDWKTWYDGMMQVYPPKDKGSYETLNYGLVTTPLHQCAAAVPTDEWDKTMPSNHTTGANMYAFLASQSPVNLTRASVLEISHGRGGGAALISDCYCPRMMVGVDASRLQTKYAKARYARAGECPIGFLEADANKLPFGDNHFDVILNVESSHAYPDYRTFIKEVKRVLKPGGAFLSSDYRYKFGSEAPGLIMQDEFQSPVTIMDVSSGVLQSLNENRLIKPFVDACSADFVSANKNEDVRLNEAYPKYFKEWARQTAEEATGLHAEHPDLDAQVAGMPKRHKELGVPHPTTCANHAGIDHHDYLQTGKMLYMVHIVTKNKEDKLQANSASDNQESEGEAHDSDDEDDDVDDE